MTLANGERDLWLAGASALVAAVALTLAFGIGRPREDADTPTVAAVKQASGQIKLRPAQTLGWRGAARGVDVHDGDAIFVPPGAEATIAFLDGTELALDERSLVVIERPKAGVRNVSLRQGSVSGRAGAQGLTLLTPEGEAHLEAQSEARVELVGKQLEVSVAKGKAEVKGKGGAKSVGKGQRVAAAEAATTELAPWAVELVSPPAQAQLPFRSEPAPVTLSWKGSVPAGAHVQVARDRLFAFVEQELDARGDSVVLDAPSRGVNWWRLVDERGQSLSESRRFTCAEDVAPVAMFPRLGEVLLAPPGTEIAFAWAPLAGITRYRLEVSPSQGFEPVTVSEPASGSSARLKVSLNEGTWFWRVRADDEQGPGMPSAPLRFRVIHKGIPEAPELLNPEIEVTP
ncbi:MAG: FecR domain-containing protein [Myxococcota bacterium]